MVGNGADVLLTVPGTAASRPFRSVVRRSCWAQPSARRTVRRQRPHQTATRERCTLVAVSRSTA